MTEKAAFIKIPPTEGVPQTMPTESDRRVAENDIKIQICNEADAEKIAEGLYLAFPDSWWEKKEPPSQRPPTHAQRVYNLTTRTRPSLSHPDMRWIKAVHLPTGTIVGIAGWATPGMPSHSIFRRSAHTFYGWKEKSGLSDEEFDALWAQTDMEQWDNKFEKDDKTREEVVQGEPHWYLAPLFTWPEWQGRGIGKLLLDWAIKQADATEPVMPIYLESASYARAVYMHCGFVPQGEYNFLRRGPTIVRGLEAEAEAEDGKDDPEKVGVQVVAQEVRSEVAGE